MKKILLLVSLSLSLVYLGCKEDETKDDPTVPPPSSERPLGTDDIIVSPEAVDLDKVAPTEILPCELTTKQFASQEELVQAFEKASCVVNGNLDQDCLNRYNYENCYKTRAPNPSSSSVLTCTRANSDDELSFTFNTYNNLPGEGLLCDVIDYKDSMLFYARNQSNSCRSMWSSYKAQQGYRCSDDPPVAQEDPPAEVAPEPEPTPSETDATESYSITNQGGGVVVTVSLNEQYVNLAENDCVQVNAEDFNQLFITTDAGKDVCSVGNCREAGHYTVEPRRGQFLWLSTVYRLIESSANPTCNNTL